MKYLLMLNRSIILIFMLAIPVKAAELSPFVDINDVTSCFVDSDTIRFHSDFGFRNYDRNTGMWHIGVSPIFSIFQRTSDFYGDFSYPPDTTIALPDWYKYCYQRSLACVRTDSGSYVLTVLAGEGATFDVNDIVDVDRQRIYRLPFMNCRTLVVTEPYLWVGHKRGISKIDTRTGARTDYIVFPMFDRLTGYVDTGSRRYITTAEGLLFEFNLDDGSIQQIAIPEQIKRKIYADHCPITDNIDQQQWVRRSDLYIAWWAATISNPVIVENKLYVAIYTRGQYWTACQSALLGYDLCTREWSYHSIPGNCALRKLMILNGRIWALGNQSFADQGEVTDIGGVAVMVDSGAMKVFPELTASNVAFLAEGTELSLLSPIYDVDYSPPPSHATVVRFDLNTCELIDTKIISIDAPEINRFIPLAFSINEETEMLLRQWRVQLRMLAIPRPPARILSGEPTAWFPGGDEGYFSKEYFYMGLTP